VESGVDPPRGKRRVARVRSTLLKRGGEKSHDRQQTEELKLKPCLLVFISQVLTGFALAGRLVVWGEFGTNGGVEEKSNFSRN